MRLPALGRGPAIAGSPSRHVVRAALGLALIPAAIPAFAAGESPAPELDRFYFRLANGPRELARVAGCLINQQPDKARALFDRDVGSPAHNQAVTEFSRHGGNCLFATTELRWSNIMFIGSVAEMLLEKDKPARPTQVAAPMSFPQTGGGTHLWTWRNLNNQSVYRVQVLSYCLLQRHPDQVEAILDSRSHSDGERRHFNALNDEIDGCIPTGESWYLQPQILRAAFAIAYYRSARAGLSARPALASERDAALQEAAQ